MIKSGYRVSQRVRDPRLERLQEMYRRATTAAQRWEISAKIDAHLALVRPVLPLKKGEVSHDER